MISRREFLKLLAAAGAISLAPAQIGCTAACDPNTLLEIIDRATWGAADPQIPTSIEGFYDSTLNPGGWYVYKEPLHTALTTIIIHHTATILNEDPQNIQSNHMLKDRYADIAYQYLINQSGKIFEGRSINVRGTHTGGHNTGTIGVALFGNFESQAPTQDQLCSLKRLTTWLKVTYELTHLAGHNDFQPFETVCPGENLASDLQNLAKELRMEYGTAGYTGIPES